MNKTSFQGIVLSFVLMFFAISCSEAKKKDSDANKAKTEAATETENVTAKSLDDVVKANLTALFYDIAQLKSERFHWLNKDDVLRMSGGKAEKYEDGDVRGFIVEQPEEWAKEIGHALASFKEEGDRVGFDFSNYSFESLDLESREDEVSGGTICRGKAVLKSGNRLFDVEFKNMIILDGEAKFLDGFGVEPHKKTAE